MTDALEDTARRIAQGGREALLERLRPAFEEAASAHADVLPLGPEQLESMVQRAADAADGLQWRRALAAVAAQELEIGLGEALGHPAVARAQAILGAPSYEESLAQLTGRAPDDQAPISKGAQTGRKVRKDERPRGDMNVRTSAEQTLAPSGGSQPADDAPARRAQDDKPATWESDFPRLRLPAVHLGGIVKLAPGERNLALRFSDDGIEIVRGQNDGSVGRINKTDISGVEIPTVRGRLHRRRPSATHLIVRTKQGDASFEIPSMTPDQLRRRLAPVLEQLEK